ncbi:30S ribosomal protein S2 [bacterium]|nr:30S ribosomal protein S2 [bacterium]
MPKPKTPKIEELFDAGVHYGHQVRRWHPNMEQYIYTAKQNVHIINLELTEKMIEDACDFLYETASKGGTIIFVGTKRQAREIVKLEAKRCGAKYVTERWLGGTITNFRVIKKNVDKLVDMMHKRESGEYEKYTKKERLMIDRDIEKLEKSVGGIVGMDNVPAAVFVVDARREKTAVREATRAKVPVVGLVDTNSDPTNINYVVPGNDDAIKAVALIVKTIADAAEAGYKDFGKKKEEKVEKKEEK